MQSSLYFASFVFLFYLVCVNHERCSVSGVAFLFFFFWFDSNKCLHHTC